MNFILDNIKRKPVNYSITKSNKTVPLLNRFHKQKDAKK